MTSFCATPSSRARATTLLNPLRVGRCYGCDRPTWRTAVAQRNDASQGITAGQAFPLWPSPDSFYVTLALADGNTAPGIGFCADCVPMMFDHVRVRAQPANGEPYVVTGPVVGVDAAYGRYADWYSEGREQFYRDWFRDALSLDAPTIDALLALWRTDRNGRYGAHC